MMYHFPWSGIRAQALLIEPPSYLAKMLTMHACEWRIVNLASDALIIESQVY